LTGEIVNLRKARKAKARSGKEALAAENRVRFGRSKAERLQVQAQDELSARRLEGHRLGNEDDQP